MIVFSDLSTKCQSNHWAILIFRNMKLIFEVIQNTVNNKFPGNSQVRYTSVGGFIFLRFFAPAILNPSLFGLKIGPQDAASTRKLLLVAKTLQNLSNLVEFGQKEPFMAPMNTFITSRINQMKSFIDLISVTQSLDPQHKPSEPHISTSVHPASETSSRDCAELHGLLVLSIEKLNAFQPPCQLVPKLAAILTSVSVKIKDVEKKDALYPFDISSDLGVDVSTDNILEQDGEEEKRVLRMINKCITNADIDMPLTASSIGFYKDSGDLRDQMVKGQVHGQITLPISFITSPMEIVGSVILMIANFHTP